MQDGATEYTEGDVKIIIQEPWVVTNNRNVLRVKVKAYTLDGHHLDVDDGVFEFANTPAGRPVMGDLIRIIRTMNGLA